MNSIHAALTNLARRTGLFTEEQATAAYNGLWLKLAYALFACAVAFSLNAMFGWKVPSLLLALVFAIVAFYVWAKPLHVLGVAGTGLAAKLVTHEEIAIEVEKVLKVYLEILTWVLIVGGVFLLTTGTFSFSGSPAASLRLLIALGVVGLFILKWPDIFVGTKGRRFFFASALLIAVFSFVSIILGPTWVVKYTGWDPVSAKTTSTEEALYRLDHARQDIADADRATELERITRKVENREALTRAEVQFVAETQRATMHEKIVQQEKVLTLSAPANGDSPPLPTRTGHPVAFTGNGFITYCVYSDGHTGFVGDPIHPCSDGPILYVGVHDTSGRANTVTYEYR